MARIAGSRLITNLEARCIVLTIKLLSMVIDNDNSRYTANRKAYKHNHLINSLVLNHPFVLQPISLKPSASCGTDWNRLR